MLFLYLDCESPNQYCQYPEAEPTKQWHDTPNKFVLDCHFF